LSELAAANFNASDRARGAEPGDVRGRHPEPGEDALRVLAEPGRLRPDRSGGLGELDGRPRKDPGTLPHRHAAMADLRVGEDLAQPIHRPEADLLLGEPAHPLGERPLAERGAKEREHLVALRAFVPLRRDEILAAEEPAEPRPEMSLVRRDREMP